MFFSTRESSPNLYLLSLKCFLSWPVSPPARAQCKPMKTKDKHTPTHADDFQSHFWSWRSHDYEIYIQNTNSVCQRTHCPILPVREAVWSTLSAAASSPITCYPSHHSYLFNRCFSSMSTPPPFPRLWAPGGQSLTCSLPLQLTQHFLECSMKL